MEFVYGVDTATERRWIGIFFDGNNQVIIERDPKMETFSQKRLRQNLLIFVRVLLK